jgi:hypothetical protein
METKFTKGEWKIDGRTVYSLHQRGWDRGKPIMCNRFYLSVYPDYSIENAVEEAEANAKLIAAAPELLKALFRICKDAEIMALGESGNFVSVSIDSINEGIKAIKKATS